MRAILPVSTSEGTSPLNGQMLAQSVQNEESNLAQKLRNDNELFIRRTFEECPQKGCELLFRRYHKVLCSHAVRIVYSKEIAEDLVSEVFFKFWKTRAYESVTTSYRFYLFRCIRNEAFNYLRLEFHKLEGIEMAEMQESSRSQRPDHITQFEEVLTRVEVLVESLPPQCRKVFLMNRFEGFKYKDIADELGISVKTVEVHMHKALTTMRQGLKDHWLVSVFLLLLA
ncbi:RNA polymerase sigma-70 factor [Telluribacter sp.]|jgi:RNA polymerase sigma-70 factor (ECF subfamily)|uniref:RNA polymerase sigma-70 factor n=1 Tax=Telluribacter sp. TaxID=1978767 RepID=UPI002E164950|nr:RNA polymerase sigma-70 factor [Telluribacter sp.]